MKRHSLHAIVRKVQLLSVDADRNSNQFFEKPVLECVFKYARYLRIINKAAVNEIIRLQDEDRIVEAISKKFDAVDMKIESEKFLENVKTICDDYNAKILNK